MGETSSTVEALEVIATSVADGWEQADTAREALPRARADAEALRRQVRYTDELKDELEALKLRLAAALVVGETQAEEIERLRTEMKRRMAATAERTQMDGERLTAQAEELERLRAVAAAAEDVRTYFDGAPLYDALDALTTDTGETE